MNWFLLGGSLACAGFVQGLTGFGFGLVSMSIMPLFMNVKEAAAISTVFSLLATVTTFIRHAHDYNWRLGFVFLLCACVGVPVGVYFLDRTNESLLVHILGALMVVIAAHELLSKRKIERVPTTVTVPLGLFSGALSGAFNLGGTPTAAYAYAHQWTRGQIIAFLQVMITVSCVLRMVCYARFGYFQQFSWTRGLLLAAPLYLAIAGGHACLQKISPAHMRRAIFIFIAVAGLYYLFLHHSKP